MFLFEKQTRRRKIAYKKNSKMSPEKNIYTNWKQEKTILERYENSTAIEGELPHFQKKFSFSFQNAPLRFLKIKLAFTFATWAGTCALPVFFKSVGSVPEGAVYRLSHNGGSGHAGQLTEPVAAVHYRKERRRNRVAQDKVRI